SPGSRKGFSAVSDLFCLADPAASEMNAYFYFQQVAEALAESPTGHLQVEILEFLVAAGTTRGWFPDVASVIGRFGEHDGEAAAREALGELRYRRLLSLEPAGARIDAIIGG